VELPGELQELDDVLTEDYHHLREFALKFVKVVHAPKPVATIDNDLKMMFSQGFPQC
jgi:hypothetical protein